VILLAVGPFVVSALLGLSAPRIVRHTVPRAAARVLVPAALLTALATGLVLCSVAALALAELPASGRAGHWSTATLHSRAPVPDLVGLGSGLLAVVLLLAAGRFLVRTGRRLRAAIRASHDLGPGSGGLVVLDHHRPAAFAVPGAGGRMVVTSALLRRLDAGGRRAVLAHEEAHLRHRHHLYVQLAELAAAANPLLRPVSRAVRLAVECWADDEAAADVGDRVVVARALAATGVARAPEGTSALALSATDTDLVHRVRRLMAPPAHRVRPALGTLTAGALAAGISAALLAATAHTYLEQAQNAYFATRGR
jgi:hypothetical protein